MDEAGSDLLKPLADRFERDYEAWFREGESKGRGVGMPRLLRAERPSAGVILLHGYMAAPEEPALLGEKLRGLGLTVCLPRLPGHGTSPANLAAVGWRDWAAAADEAYRLVSGLCGRWVIAGFSTGAGLALHEAASHPGRYEALVSISAPLRLSVPKARWMPAYDRLLAIGRALGLAGPDAGFFENRPDNPEINYRRNCVHGVAEVERLMRRVRRELGVIRIPALVMQGSGDRTVDPSSPREVLAGLGSADKRLVAVPSDRHGIVRGPSLGATFEAFSAFLAERGLLG